MGVGIAKPCVAGHLLRVRLIEFALCLNDRFLATFDDQITRRGVVATAWNSRLTEGQINRLRTKTPDVCQGQIALLGQRLLPAT